MLTSLCYSTPYVLFVTKTKLAIGITPFSYTQLLHGNITAFLNKIQKSTHFPLKGDVRFDISLVIMGKASALYTYILPFYLGNVNSHIIQDFYTFFVRCARIFTPMF